jgi:hypothetical protein
LGGWELGRLAPALAAATRWLHPSAGRAGDAGFVRPAGWSAVTDCSSAECGYGGVGFVAGGGVGFVASSVSAATGGDGGGGVGFVSYGGDRGGGGDGADEADAVGGGRGSGGGAAPEE